MAAEIKEEKIDNKQTNKQTNKQEVM